MQTVTSTNTNNLFPVFLKLEEMNVLLVGAGKVGLEKLQSVITNAPATNITIVALNICKEIKAFAALRANILLVEKAFEPTDLDEKNIVIVAVNDLLLSEYIRGCASEKNLLVNVA
ncbi:MAG TPA: NAD(P)-dependent oxidoreductase, partial [Chitinophagaceae bacterium]